MHLRSHELAAVLAAACLSTSWGLQETLFSAIEIPGGPEEAAVYVHGADADTTMEPGRPDVARYGIGTRNSSRTVSDLFKMSVVPVLVLALGIAVWLLWPRFKMAAQIMVFFGVETFMSIYMKAVLSRIVVSEEFHMRGFQAPLLLTALQQLVGFVFLSLLIGLSYFTTTPYKPKMLKTWREVGMILALSVTFTANIALNNSSLSLLDMSANVVIRSGGPLTSMMLQVIFRHWLAPVDVRLGKFLMVVCGFLCAVLVVISKHEGSTTASRPHYTLGVILCLSSLFFASLELIVVAMLGVENNSKLNAFDTLLYMAPPIFMLLLLPSLFLAHPVTYGNYGSMTDWQVLVEVCQLNPTSLVLVLLSGIWAVCYNFFLYNVTRDLSPVFATFAASFNKAAIIALSLALNFEHLPSTPWNFVMVIGVLGNVAFFLGFALYPRGKPEKAEASKPELHDSPTDASSKRA